MQVKTNESKIFEERIVQLQNLSADQRENLSILNLSTSKEIEQLPSWMGQLAGLEHLDLSGCWRLGELPSWMGQLTGLQHLDLSRCSSLNELPSGMGQLTGLQHLDLSGCYSLRELPSWMGQLTGLQHLDLSWCNVLEELPSGMGQLTGLQHLDLSGCMLLEELPSGVGQLTGLQHLDLSECESLKELPSGMGQLTGLQHLGLSMCKSLEELPSGMGQLTGLRHLDLLGCVSLKELPSGMGQLTGLSTLLLPSALHTPPRDIRELGLQHILQYLRDLSTGSAPCYIVKLVLVGDHGAGKSSLGDSMQAGEPHPRAEADRTVGIDVCRWMLGSKSQVIAHVFDTAGHKVYQASHRVFMSRDCLYLAVVRCDQAAERAGSSVVKWMDIAESVSPGCVMAVVGTCIDLCDEDIDVYMGKVMESVKRARRDAGLEVATELERLEDMVEEKLRPEDERKWRELRGERDFQLEKLEKDLFVLYKPLAASRRLGCPEASGNAIISRVEELHGAMEDLERSAVKASDEELLSRVVELRHLRARRLRGIFCRAVSNTTGEGLGEVKESLLGILESRELFPHLGMKVPLSYSLLERCMRRVPATPGDMPMADWERACEKHHMEKAAECGEAVERLQEVCRGDVVKLSTLREAAGACGIGEDELASAITFLHASGSLLFFGGEGAGADGRVLQEHVFSRPGWIIDAVKCFIHERRPEDLNDECRAMLARVEQRYDGELREYRRAGRLSGKLLRGLWASHDEGQGGQEEAAGRAGFRRHHKVLVALMCSLRLMRRVSAAEGSGEEKAMMMGAWEEEEETEYVVPAMFAAEALPARLVEPRWLPEEARGAEAWMRRQYQGIGQVPYGLLSELQVEWSCRSDDVKHYGAEKDALASSLGSHLVATYGEEGAEVEEHVVVSLWQEDEEAGEGASVVRSRLCVMGWTRLKKGSVRGTATWELFRHVTGCINRRLKDRPCALGSTEPMVPWVDRSREKQSLTRNPWFWLSVAVAMTLQLTRHRLRRFVIDTWKNASAVRRAMCALISATAAMVLHSLRGGRGGVRTGACGSEHFVLLSKCARSTREVDVDGRRVPLHELLPTAGHSITAKVVGFESVINRFRVTNPTHADRPGNAAGGSEAVRSSLNIQEEVKAPGILAFFAQQSGDRINIQRESQELTRRVRMRRSMEFTSNNQPTFEEFRDALMCASRDHVRVLHLSGHGDGKKGFYLLRDATGSTREAISAEILTALIAQTSADAGGTVDCVVLNACETEAMGRALRGAGVRHVVCWRWEVATGAAMAFAEAFYNQLLFLVEEGGADALTPEAYRKAFSQGKAQFQVWEGRPKQEESERKGTGVGWSGKNGLLWLSRDGDDESCVAQRR